MAAKKKATDEAAPAVDPQAELQAQADVVAEQGYVGIVPDATPNENYTVGGVLKGKPTPELKRKESWGNA